MQGVFFFCVSPKTKGSVPAARNRDSGCSLSARWWEEQRESVNEEAS